MTAKCRIMLRKSLRGDSQEAAQGAADCLVLGRLYAWHNQVKCLILISKSGSCMNFSKNKPEPNECNTDILVENMFHIQNWLECFRFIQDQVILLLGPGPSSSKPD